MSKLPVESDASKASNAPGRAPQLRHPGNGQTRLLTRARQTAECLAKHPAVEGVCVFGSVARGDCNSLSDIDLLVLVARSNPGRRGLIQELPTRLQRQRLTLLPYSKDDLGRVIASGTSFSEHLRREAVVLVDKRGRLANMLNQIPTSRVSVRDELRAELGQLSVYEDLSIFNGNYLFVLARVYAVGKAIVMLGLSSRGTPTFDREKAFQRFRGLHPNLDQEVDTILTLRPFYKLVTRRGEEELPFAYRNCEDEVRRAIESVRAMAEAIA